MNSPNIHDGMLRCQDFSHNSRKKIGPPFPVEVSEMAPKPPSTRARIVWSLLYLSTLLAVTGGMIEGRRQAIRLYGTDEAQADWTRWVDDVRDVGGEGPVQRRTPQTPRPPALVLMQEQFLTCLIGALVLSSALFATVAFFVHGVLTTPPLDVEGPGNGTRHPPRGRHE